MVANMVQTGAMSLVGGGESALAKFADPLALIPPPTLPPLSLSSPSASSGSSDGGGGGSRSNGLLTGLFIPPPILPTALPPLLLADVGRTPTASTRIYRARTFSSQVRRVVSSLDLSSIPN